MTMDQGPAQHADAVVVGAGQSGLAAARALAAHRLHVVVLEAASSAAGSWPHYYDSLTAFSPAGFCALPGLPFPGDQHRYPHRDEVADYLRLYAAHLEVDLRLNTRAEVITRDGDSAFHVSTTQGPLTARAVVMATGSFANPVIPAVRGAERFAGRQISCAQYQRPDDFADLRVVVVGGGNSGVQIAYELAGGAQTRLATRRPVRFIPQTIGGRDVHHWLKVSGLDRWPSAIVHRVGIGSTPVLDDGRYAAALAAGQPRRVAMFDAIDEHGVRWTDGSQAKVDAIVWATGYAPVVDALRLEGVLDPTGRPRHAGGLSTVAPGLAWVGLERQRTFASNTLRGVYRDAEHVASHVATLLRG